jgi:hypothetical protein
MVKSLQIALCFVFLPFQEIDSNELVPFLRQAVAWHRGIDLNKAYGISSQNKFVNLDFEKKRVYFAQYYDSLKTNLYLQTTHKTERFDDLELSGIASKIKSAHGKRIDLSYQGLGLEMHGCMVSPEDRKINIVADSNQADIKVLMTCVFEVNDIKYCIFQIKENNRTWVLRIKKDENGMFWEDLDIFPEAYSYFIKH